MGPPPKELRLQNELACICRPLLRKNGQNLPASRISLRVLLASSVLLYKLVHGST